ncbi:DUF3087 family protein [Thalassolituus sp. LLYu03]|uniref:DUF3087 family protein n=1 Tax=Thalassolituus sp. LLYu03 TaxID=3421656 RepID=UPI003D29DAA4
MKLQTIDQALFKKRLNLFQGTLVVLLMVLGLGFSQLYIGLWSDGGSNTLLNLAAVATAVVLIGIGVNQIKDKPFMREIMYVRALKQELNRIYRASRKLEEAVKADNRDALTVRYFQLHASKHLYELEGNTLTMEEQLGMIATLDEQLARLGLSLKVEDYSPELLKRF